MQTSWTQIRSKMSGLILIQTVWNWNGRNPDLTLRFCRAWYWSTLFAYVPQNNVCLLPPDNLCKNVGPRSGPTFSRARSGSKLFALWWYVASGLNCLCPTKRIENSKLAVGFTPQFLYESSLFAEVHLWIAQYKNFFPEQYISCRCKIDNWFWQHYLELTT